MDAGLYKNLSDNRHPELVSGSSAIVPFLMIEMLK
jgi:hypothetical protein